MGLIIFHDDPVLLRSLPLIKITGCPEDLKAKTPPDSWGAQRCNSERRFGLNRGNRIATWRAKAAPEGMDFKCGRKRSGARPLWG
jgi:hypothetical protein